MKGKLKTLEEVFKIKPIKNRNGFTVVYHSNVNKSIDVENGSKKKFGWIIEVELWEDKGNRKIYYDGESKDKYGQLYYDEWFEYVGEKIEHIPYELWSIEDL